MSSFTVQQEGPDPFNSSIPPINPNNTILPDLNITNTNSRLDRIEQRLSIVEQLLTQQEQLQNISFASNTPPGPPLTMSMLEQNSGTSDLNRTNEETLPTQSSISSVGGKNKTKSNKKKKSKNQTKRKRKV